MWIRGELSMSENRAMLRVLTIPEGDDQKKPVSKERDGRRRHGIEGLLVTAWPPTYDWYTTTVFNHRAISPLNPALSLPENAGSRRKFAQAFTDAERRGHELMPNARSYAGTRRRAIAANFSPLLEKHRFRNNGMDTLFFREIYESYILSQEELNREIDFLRLLFLIR